MDVLRRSSVFAAEVLDVFDRSLTEKELVSQSKALCRDYILSRIHQNGLGWSKSELNLLPSNAALSEVSLVLLCLGERNPTHRSSWQLACEIAGLVFFWTLSLINFIHLILSCLPFSPSTAAVLWIHGLNITSLFEQNIDVINNRFASYIPRMSIQEMWTQAEVAQFLKYIILAIIWSNKTH